MRDKALEIYNHYGYKNQLKKLSEEVYEFIEAVLEFEAGNGDINHVIEEMGDVEFMMYQFRVANDIKQREIKRVFQSKADRQLHRIKTDKPFTLISDICEGVLGSIKKLFGIK